MLVDWMNDHCQDWCTLNHKYLQNSSLSVHIHFLNSLFPPYCIECQGLCSLVENMLWSLSFHPHQVSFLLNSHGKSFFKCKALKETAMSSQVPVCPARTSWAFNKSFDEFQLVGIYKKQLWFPERNRDCLNLLSLTLGCLLSLASDNRLHCFAFYSQMNWLKITFWVFLLSQCTHFELIPSNILSIPNGTLNLLEEVEKGIFEKCAHCSSLIYSFI